MVFPSPHNAEARRNYEDPLFDQVRYKCDQQQLFRHQLYVQTDFVVILFIAFRLKSPGLALEEESRGNYMNLVKYTIKCGVGGWRLETRNVECICNSCNPLASQRHIDWEQ